MSLAFVCIFGMSDLHSLGTNFFQLTNWYIWEQIFFYIIFYLTCKFCPKYKCIAVLIVTAFAMTIVFYAGWIEGYYASALGFPLGMFVGEYYEKVTKWLMSVGGKIAVLLGCALGMTALMFDENSLVGMVYLRNILCVSGLLLLLMILKNVHFRNRILKFLQKHSSEIYLFQFSWLRITERFFPIG